MAKNETKNEPGKPAVANGAAGSDQPSMTMVAQYVRDLSFENPRAPRSFMNQDKPQLDFNVNVRAQKSGDTTFEVNLLLNVKATDSANEPLFVVELSYSGLFALVNIPEEHREAILLVDCPFLLFPFARRVIADAIRDGGFPPLLLDPIDFRGLYLSRKQQEQQAKPAAA